MTERPLPTPVVLALPRTRRLLDRFFRWLDRRKAHKIAMTNQSVLDWQWSQQYKIWWEDGGWMHGAPPIENKAAAYAFARQNGTPARHGSRPGL
jgi:hypothetical protein